MTARCLEMVERCGNETILKNSRPPGLLGEEENVQKYDDSGRSAHVYCSVSDHLL